MLKEFTLLNANCDLFSQVVLCFSQQQKKLGMQPCMNLGSSLETGATLTLVPRQSQVEFVSTADSTWVLPFDQHECCRDFKAHSPILVKPHARHPLLQTDVSKRQEGGV